MPTYVLTKQYYDIIYNTAFTHTSTAAAKSTNDTDSIKRIVDSNNDNNTAKSPLLLCPKQRYNYYTPLGLREKKKNKNNKKSLSHVNKVVIVTIFFFSVVIIFEI